MPKPRWVRAGTVYLVTRRCANRNCFFAPDAKGDVAEMFGYCLALVAERYGVEVHGAIALSNHWHAVITDVNGRLGEFLRDMHALTAGCANARLGRCENVWAVRQASAVNLADRGAVWAKLVYCLGNAVSSGLVAHHTAWPGFHTLPGSLVASPRVYRRPRYFFGPNTPNPEEARLVITKPAVFAHLTDAAYVAELKRRLAAMESEERRGAKKLKRPFLGVAAILAQDPHSRPPDLSIEPRGGVNPTVAAEDKTVRFAELALLADFRRAYAAALALWRQGVRDVLFPSGTYQLVLMHRVCVHPAPT